MLAGGGVLVVAGLLSVARPALRVRRRAAALGATVAASRFDVDRALALLLAQHAETEALMRPWRRLARLARHPLVVASLEWYLRQRRRSRSLHGQVQPPSTRDHG